MKFNSRHCSKVMGKGVHMVLRKFCSQVPVLDIRCRYTNSSSSRAAAYSSFAITTELCYCDLPVLAIARATAET